MKIFQSQTTQIIWFSDHGHNQLFSFFSNVKGFSKTGHLLCDWMRWISAPERDLILTFVPCRGLWSASGGDGAVWAALWGAFGSSGGGAVCDLHPGARPAWSGFVSPVRTGQSGQRTAGGFWCRGETVLRQVQSLSLLPVLVPVHVFFKGLKSSSLCVSPAAAQTSTRWRHCWSSTSDSCRSLWFHTVATRNSSSVVRSCQVTAHW